MSINESITATLFVLALIVGFMSLVMAGGLAWQSINHDAPLNPLARVGFLVASLGMLTLAIWILSNAPSLIQPWSGWPS